MDKSQLEKLLGLCEHWVGLCLTGRIRMASRGETISDHGAQSQEMFSKCRVQDEGCVEKKQAGQWGSLGRELKYKAQLLGLIRTVDPKQEIILIKVVTRRERLPPAGPARRPL